MDVEKLKELVRFATTIIYIIVDVFWVCYSMDDSWKRWWAKACMVVNLLLLIVGIGAAAVWAWT